VAKTEDKLARMYYLLGRPTAFTTADKLHKAAASKVQDHAHTPTRAAVNKFLESLDTYTLHKPVCMNFPHKAYIVKNILDLWQNNLLEFQNHVKENDNYRYILSVIDVFFKYSTCI
jgi:hypothetical protein